jgi:hypothetical protein
MCRKRQARAVDATELDRRIAAALNAGSSGPFGDTVMLADIHGRLSKMTHRANERELLGRIEKVKSRIASQKRQIKRWKGNPATATAEQFLVHLEAKHRYLEADLATLRMGGSARRHTS